MTEDEKLQERRDKDRCVRLLKAIDVDSYELEQIDDRIKEYVLSVIRNTTEHNIDECFMVLRFFRLLDKYEFRIDQAQCFIVVYEHLKFDGPNGRQTYKLTPIQTFFFAWVYGFYKDETHRLVHLAVWFLPRKFSKTTSVCSIGIYDFLFGDANAQVYCAANSFQQAQIAYGEIKKVIRSSVDPKMKRFKLNRDLIKWKDGQERDAIIRCLATSPDKLDGLNASTVIYDEVSQADNYDMLNVLTTSMGTRENPMVVQITTASDKPNAPFARDLEYYKKALRNETLDDSIMVALFHADCDDEEDDPKTWYKVQPHLGVTVKESFYRDEYEKSKKSAEDKKAFRTKLLNEYDTGTGRTWILGKTIRDNMRKLNIDAIGAMDTIVSVDLSATNDLSAVTYLIYLYNEKKMHSTTEYYISEECLATHENRDLYKRWVEDGWMHVCKGKFIDYTQMVRDIWEHGTHLNIVKISYDPNRGAEFTNELIARGAGDYMEPYKQTYFYFTKPCEAIPRMIEEKVLTFGPNPVTAYCFDNAVLDIDRMQNCKPMKKQEKLKIDGCITNCMAVGTSLNIERKATLV